MHFIASGLIKVDRRSELEKILLIEPNYIGKILFTESTFFAFRSDPKPPNVSLLFGVIGGLIYALASAKQADKAKKEPRAHLAYPEIASLDASTQKMLATTTLICSFPIDAGFSVTRSALGFTFATAGHPEVQYKGWLFKKRIIAYLNQRGISV